MKKVFVLLLALMMVGTAFAQDAKPAYTITGDATATWGINLETQKHGFNNDANFSITFPIAESATASKGGENVYGMIEIADINLSIVDDFDNDTRPMLSNEDADENSAAVTAKIVAGDAYVKIYSKPSFKYTNAVWVPLFNEDAGYDATSALIPEYAGRKGGITLGYAFGDLGTIAVKIASNGDWGVTTTTAGVATTVVYTATGDETVVAGVTYTDFDYTPVLATALVEGQVYLQTTAAAAATTTANDKYTFGADLTLTPIEMLTVNAGAFYNMESKYLGATGKFSLAPMDALSMYAAIDMEKADTADLAYDVSGNVTFSFLEAKDSIAFDAYYYEPTGLDLGLKLTETALVPNLSLTLGGYLYDALESNDPMHMAVAETLSYKAMLGEVNYVKPYQKAWYDFQGEELYVNVGVEAVLIANTTFTVDYKAGVAGVDNNMSLVKTKAADSSILTFKTKIAF